MSRKGWIGKGFLGMMNRSQEIDYPPKRKKPWLTKGFTFAEMEALHYQNPDIGGGIGDPNNPPPPPVDPECLEWFTKTIIVSGNTYYNNPAFIASLYDDPDACTKLHLIITSCLQANSLCYCLSCEALSSQIDIPCSEPMNPDCQTMVCDNPSDPCPPFTLTGNEAELPAPVTLCPSTPICAANISGGTAVGNCVYVPDEGCGTKTVSVTDICGNTVSKKVRMSSGVWQFVFSETAQLSCGGLSTSTCEAVAGETKNVYTDNCFAPNCTSSLGVGGCGTVCQPVYEGRLNLLINRREYRWVCP